MTVTEGKRLVVRKGIPNFIVVQSIWSIFLPKVKSEIVVADEIAETCVDTILMLKREDWRQ